MQFNSSLYLAFLVVVVWCYYQLTPPYRRVLLLAASYAFYWVWSVPFSSLLLLSTAVDYCAARYIDATHGGRRRLGLIFSLVANLGVLAIFKYADFFSNSSYSLFGVRPWPQLDLVLPLGISFYTFQTLSYTIDVYRRVAPVRRSFLDVALYVSFFPQLVAGPIIRSKTLIDQLDCRFSLDWDGIRHGVAQILWGLAKKVYVADTLARIVDEVYAAPGEVSGAGLWLATYAFVVQVYCDFSGYSDIAIGSARTLGIRIPANFEKPYLAGSVRDFWRRWHISLSTWLRDYLYFPLGGSRLGRVRTYVNLMLTMVICGLWHGAGWTWVVFGALHGFMLSIERIFNIEQGDFGTRVLRLFRWSLTFHLVCISWVFVRATDLEVATTVLMRIATWEPGRIPLTWAPLLGLALLLVAERMDWKARWLAWFQRHPLLAVWVSLLAAILLMATYAGSSPPEFFYFQF